MIQLHTATETLTDHLEKVAARQQKHIAKIEAHREKVLERVEHHRVKVLERREKAIAKAERKRAETLELMESHRQRALEHREKTLQKLESCHLEVLNKVTLIQYGDDGGMVLDAERKHYKQSHHAHRFATAAEDDASEFDVNIFETDTAGDEASSNDCTPMVTPTGESYRTLSSAGTSSTLVETPVISSATGEWSKQTAMSRRQGSCDLSL